MNSEFVFDGRKWRLENIKPDMLSTNIIDQNGKMNPIRKWCTFRVKCISDPEIDVIKVDSHTNILKDIDEETFIMNFKVALENKQE
ncbi:hypothetical protein JXA32_09105 [Candidatus Sumerlaeota bacterium]|nr:hypothetical protein [Candidatus Sumerlaeota bacterium]